LYSDVLYAIVFWHEEMAELKRLTAAASKNPPPEFELAGGFFIWI
jgi:hypothetical protein